MTTPSRVDRPGRWHRRPVDLLGLEGGIVEEFHHLRVGGEPWILGEVLARGDLRVAHVAEQLKVAEVVGAAVGHCLDVVHLASDELVALPAHEIRADLLGDARPPPVQVFVDEPPYETGHLLSVVGKTQTRLILELLSEQAELVRVRGDADDTDDGLMVLPLRSLLATGVGQLYDEGLDGADVLELRVW